MKRHLPTLLAWLCVSAFTGIAQTSPKRTDTSPRTVVPARTQPQPAANPFLQAPAQTAPPLPPQSIRVQPRPFNLDTALARLLADLKAVTAVGEFELSVTNAGKVTVTRLPLLLHMMEGRVRTELDLSSVPVSIDSNGPFTALRASGINRVVTLTMSAVNFRLTHQIFPDAKAFITQQLPDEDIAALIRLEKVSLGKDPVSGMEKFLGTLTYINGEKRHARLWQTAAATPQLAQVQFDIGDSLITVRFNSLQSLADTRTPEALARATALFQIPTNYIKHSDVGQMLQIFSASQTRIRR